MEFKKLVGVIRDVHEKLAAQAGRAINISLTLRNWLVGCYITEYEQRGADRAEYGARLLENLSSHLAEGGMKGVASRSLRQYRQFYLTYPGIWQTPSAKLTTTSSQPSPSVMPFTHATINLYTYPMPSMHMCIELCIARSM